jgi:hypothetical protein
MLAHCSVTAFALSPDLVAVITLSVIGFWGHIDLIHDLCAVFASL